MVKVILSLKKAWKSQWWKKMLNCFSKIALSLFSLFCWSTIGNSGRWDTPCWHSRSLSAECVCFAWMRKKCLFFCLRENVRVKDIMQKHHSMSRFLAKAKQTTQLKKLLTSFRLDLSQLCANSIFLIPIVIILVWVQYVIRQTIWPLISLPCLVSYSWDSSNFVTFNNVSI